MIATNLGISSKEKRLTRLDQTRLDQNQNFGQVNVASELYLVEVPSNLPEFGSEQTFSNSLIIHDKGK